MPLLSVAEVAAQAGVAPSTIRTYVWREKSWPGLGQGIPQPDAKLADRPAWNEETIRPWLDERSTR